MAVENMHLSVRLQVNEIEDGLRLQNRQRACIWQLFAQLSASDFQAPIARLLPAFDATDPRTFPTPAFIYFGQKTSNLVEPLGP